MDTVAIDFDGPLHSFTSPWIDTTVIPDPPTPGALEWCWRMRKDFNLVVFTCRAQSADGVRAVERWLAEKGFPYMVVTAVKPLAVMYVDDRAFLFRGKFPSLEYTSECAPSASRRAKSPTCETRSLESAAAGSVFRAATAGRPTRLTRTSTPS